MKRSSSIDVEPIGPCVSVAPRYCLVAVLVERMNVLYAVAARGSANSELSRFDRGDTPDDAQKFSSSAECARPSSSHFSSKTVPYLFTYIRRDALMRCWYSCATVPSVNVTTSRLRALVAVDGAARIRHQQIEHLADVAAGAGARAARLREQIALIEEAEVDTRRVRGVSSFTARVKNMMTWPLLSMSRRSRRTCAVGRIDERIERHADRAVLLVGEAAGRIRRVRDDDRLVGDRDDSPDANVGIRRRSRWRSR